MNTAPWTQGQSPYQRVQALYDTRRAAFTLIARFGALHFEEEQRVTGELHLPGPLADLATDSAPRALARWEMNCLAEAAVYGMEEEATAATVTLGAELAALTPTGYDTDEIRHSYSFTPPCPRGLLCWSSGVGYTLDGLPVMACHWGSTPQGPWVRWWADNRAGIAAQEHLEPAEAAGMLAMMGPLTFGDLAATLYGNDDDVPTHGDDAELPAENTIAARTALVSTTLASWAVLVSEGAAVQTRHLPTPAQQRADHRALLQPRPAVLVSSSVTTDAHTLLATDPDEGGQRT